MPGLCGLIRLRPDTPLDRDHAAATLAAMERRLRCASDEEFESTIDAARGFAIARLGLPAHRHHPWPSGRPTPGPEAAAACAAQPSAGAPPPTAAPVRGERRVYVTGLLHHDALSYEQAARQFAYTGACPASALRGFFAAVFADLTAARRITLATDRHASCPVFYAVLAGTLYFAPEVKALLALPDLPRDPDPAALAFLLSGGQLLNTQTLLTTVRRLGGGEQLIVESGRWHVEPYWSYTPRAAGDGTSALDLEHELAGAIRAAVARNLADPGATVILLSGGRDSRAILAAAHEAVGGRGERLSTATWAFDAHRADSDPATAARLAAAIGARHVCQEMPLEAYAEQFDDLLWRADALSDFPRNIRTSLRSRVSSPGAGRACYCAATSASAGGTRWSIWSTRFRKSGFDVCPACRRWLMCCARRPPASGAPPAMRRAMNWSDATPAGIPTTLRTRPIFAIGFRDISITWRR